MLVKALTAPETRPRIREQQPFSYKSESSAVLQCLRMAGADVGGGEGEAVDEGVAARDDTHRRDAERFVYSPRIQIKM